MSSATATTSTTTSASVTNVPQNKTTNIYRFKFKDFIVKELNAFAILHKHEDRKDFKENWQNWTKQNEELILKESERLNGLGYKGDIIDKMYKSVRYYFRKKPVTKNEPKQRRKYTSINRELLAAIDEHIEINMRQQNEFKPSNGFCEFYQMYEERLIMCELKRFQSEYGMDKEEADNKIKKTYKNRYFIKLDKGNDTKCLFT